MNRMDIIIEVIKKSEELRKKSSKNRLCIEINSSRITDNLEIRHYYEGALKKWIIMTNECLENTLRKKELIEYINKIN